MDALAQLTASLAGRYSIEREIGRGGMATVFLARDVRHARNVALKVLNPELGAILGVERFLSEIRVTANLQHPNLLPLFDSGEADGLLFYVMPFIQGESLRAKLNRERQLVVHDAIHIGVGAASALDYAHRHGVVHRDLKPENILLHEGQPLIADFGIALAVSNAGGARITQTGLSLGTPQYMSPEQATGDRAVDGRSDIYSLGAVIYEALAGEPPHMGGTVQAIIAKVLTEPVPDVRVRRPSVPEPVAEAIACALQKLPADRFAHAQDLALALQGRAASIPTGSTASAPILSTPLSFGGQSTYGAGRARRRLSRVAYAGVAVIGALAVAAAAWMLGRGIAPRDRNTVRLVITLPSEQAVAPVLAGPGLTISPDGSRIAYSGSAPAGTQIYIREMNDLQPRIVPGTAGGLYPFFSTDGNSLIFYSSRGLAVVPLQGGPPTFIATGPGQYPGVAPASDGRVVIGGNALPGLVVLSGPGRNSVPITKVDSAAGETAHIWPRMLPDNTTVFYTRWTRGGLNEARIGVVDIDGKNPALLDIAGTSPLGHVAGHLLYVRSDGMLMAAPVDIRRRRVLGPSIGLGTTVAVRGSGVADVALSESGDLIYMTGSLDTQGLLVGLDGGSRIVLRDMRPYSNPRFSPDGRRIAMTVANNAASDIWIYDLSAGTLSRLTTESGTNDRAEWLPNGSNVLFRSQRTGAYEIFSQPAEGGQAVSIVRMSGSVQEVSVRPGGSVAAFRTDMAPTRRDVYVVPLNGGGSAKPQPFAASPFDELMPKFSPDGKWIAYVSDESGQYEVYVRAYPSAGGRIQVSEGGGREPVWAPNGQRLFYRNGTAFMAASVSTTPTFAVQRRETLFESNYAAGPFHQNYDIAPNGREFIMFRGTESGRHIFVVLNWVAELRQRLGSN